jgi:hypothetical protein
MLLILTTLTAEGTLLVMTFTLSLKNRELVKIKLCVTCAEYNKCRPYLEMLPYKPLTNSVDLTLKCFLTSP